jgi:hypothetical protein
MLSVDLTRSDAVPYFMWDDPMTVAELRQRLATISDTERMILLGRIFQASLLRTGQPPRLSGFLAMMMGKHTG